AIAGGRVADLAEIAPERHLLALQVLAQHGHDTDGEIAGNPAADLEKADGLALALLGVPGRQAHHIFDPGAHRVDIADRPGDAVRSIDVAVGGIFPARYKH